jgi:hypothetical protein
MPMKPCLERGCPRAATAKGRALYNIATGQGNTAIGVNALGLSNDGSGRGCGPALAATPPPPCARRVQLPGSSEGGGQAAAD